MARKNQLVEMNTFVAGLVTEASPLTFPPNASLDESNFELLRNGSRRRRLGMDYEDDYEQVNTNISTSGTLEYAVNTYRWKNVGGDPTREILVVQFGNRLSFFNLTSSSISPEFIDDVTLSSESGTQPFSFSSVDGILVAATGDNSIRKLKYVSDSYISLNSYSLSVRDTFGVYESNSSGNDVTERRNSLSNVHRYNLRNQGWGVPRMGRTGTDLEDPISSFYNQDDYHRYPSNSDNLTYNLYANAASDSDRLTRRFVPKDLIANPIGTTPAPKGHFIINAFNRGSSRETAYEDALDKYDELGFLLTSNLPSDMTIKSDGNIGGPAVVAEFAGRLFYAGCPGQNEDADESSPSMSQYILFSKLIENESDFGKCYQDGDPTSPDEFDLLDTDGGLIRIGEAYNICHMVEMGNKLVVFAQNGVWALSGGSDYGFKATDYKVTKITERGVRNAKTIVVVNDAVYFWSDDGIYAIGANQMGDVVAQNMSEATINTLFVGISETDKAYADGIYDSYEKKIRWIYGNRIRNTGSVYELIFDTSLKAFYQHEIKKVSSGIPAVLSLFVTPPFRVDNYEETITYAGETITYDDEDITTNIAIKSPVTREVKYLILTDNTGYFQITFGSYKDVNFVDWFSFDEEGVDAEAYLYTGYMSGGVSMLNKMVPYITFYLERTETGFDTVDGELVPTNQSSCKVRALWDWSDDINSGRWSQEFQAYRYLRHWIPATAGSSYDYGQSVITTKNKLRGKGKVLSLYIKTDPGKDCVLLGWSMMVSSDGNA